MRFAAKWNAFCRKMECILPQNGMRFWPKMGKLKDYLLARFEERLYFCIAKT